MIEFSIHRLVRHWSLNLFVLLGLTLGSALLASLPGYSRAIAEWSLQQSFLGTAPAERNIEIHANPTALTGALNGYILENIGDIVKSRLTVQKASVLADPATPLEAGDGADRVEPQEYYICSFSTMNDLLSLVEGDWPSYSRPTTQQEIQRAMLQRPVIQVAVSQEVAQESGLQVGDTLVDMNEGKYAVVGIVEQNDPGDDIWWDDPSPFRITRIPGTNEDYIIFPLIVPPLALQDNFGSFQRSWRLLIDHEKITPANSQFWQEKLLAFKTLLEADNASMASSLSNILLTFHTNQATIRMVLLLVGTQSIIFILYTLALISVSVLERSLGEISTMAGRGASSWQLVKMLSIEGGYMVILVGCVLGPLVSWLALNAWAVISGSQLSFSLSPETLYFSLIGAGLGWISLMIGTIRVVRHSLLSWQRRLSRPERHGAWSKLYIDIFLAIFAAVLYWQLSSSGSFVIQRVRSLPSADPLLLLSPTILLIALSLILLRLFPYLLQAFAWLAQRLRGIVIPLGISRLARNPVRPNQIVLLIGVAFGMMLFMSTYDHSLTVNQQQFAHYRAGADIRLAQRNLSADTIAKQPGVERAVEVLRINVSTNTGRSMTVLAIDSPVFAEVAYYPPGMTNISIDSISRAIAWDEKTSDQEQGNNQVQTPSVWKLDTGNPIPAIFSKSALPTGKKIGDLIQIQIRTKSINLEVRGVINAFPTLTNPFIVVDRTALLTYFEQQPYILHNYSELWLETDPAFHDSVAESIGQQGLILADAKTELIKIRNNPFTEGARRAFILNAYTLASLSIAGFILLNFFSIQQRLYEFGVLRAHGMSVGQMNFLLVSEGILLIWLGILVGAGIGLGLIHSMQAFLNTALVKAFPESAVYQVVIDRSQVGGTSVLLLAAYLVAVLVFVIIAIKSGIHHSIKIGEE